MLRCGKLLYIYIMYMFVFILLLIPLVGLLIIASAITSRDETGFSPDSSQAIRIKSVALNSSVCALLASLVMFALFDFSSNQFQFVQEYHEIGLFNLYLGVDGLSIYFVLLTTIIMPISLLSN